MRRTQGTELFWESEVMSKRSKRETAVRQHFYEENRRQPTDEELKILMRHTDRDTTKARLQACSNRR